MAEPLSIASGVAGIITLSNAVVAAGYSYFNSVRSAPEDLKDLVREIALLNMLISWSKQEPRYRLSRQVSLVWDYH